MAGRSDAAGVGLLDRGVIPGRAGAKSDGGTIRLRRQPSQDPGGQSDVQGPAVGQGGDRLAARRRDPQGRRIPGGRRRRRDDRGRFNISSLNDARRRHEWHVDFRKPL